MAQVIAAGDEDLTHYMIWQLVDRVKLNKAAYEGASKAAKDLCDSISGASTAHKLERTDKAYRRADDISAIVLADSFAILERRD